MDEQEICDPILIDDSSGIQHGACFWRQGAGVVFRGSTEPVVGTGSGGDQLPAGRRLYGGTMCTCSQREIVRSGR